MGCFTEYHGSKTVIICTVGPASRDPGTLAKMVSQGMNVARLNFSHGSYDTHTELIQTIRDVSARNGRYTAILQDLAGPKIRIGRLPEAGVTLVPGTEYILTRRQVEGGSREVSITYSALPDEVRPGDQVLLADGNLELSVNAVRGDDIQCTVVIGGLLTSHKGINIPTRALQAAPPTVKDLSDLQFGLEHGVDAVAVSFVKDADCIARVLSAMDRLGRRVPVIAKIERKTAVAHLEEILDISDGIMVARGDLGVEIPLEKVPKIQKDMIRLANSRGKPVITATQMLRSMVNANRPTRAEAADVANAVWDGSDGVMLSEETAMGRYPVEAVSYMAAICRESELSFPHDRYLGMECGDDTTTAVAKAACVLADSIDARLIIAFTQSGATAARLARFRPRQPVVALSPDTETLHRMAWLWNVWPCRIDVMTDTDAMIDGAAEIVKSAGLAVPGDTVVITAGLPVASTGTTNMIRIKRIR